MRVSLRWKSFTAKLEIVVTSNQRIKNAENMEKLEHLNQIGNILKPIRY